MNDVVANTKTVKVFIVSNMYPSKKKPSYGIFVEKLERAFVENRFIISGCSYMFYSQSGVFAKLFNYVVFNLKTIFLALKKPAQMYYFHFPTHSFFSFLALKVLKKKIVVNFHGSDLMTPGLARYLFNFLICNFSKLIVVPSDYFKNQIQIKFNLPKDKIVVFPSCGVDLKKFPLKKNKQKKNMPFCFGFISNFIAGKGIEEFIESFIKLHATNKNIYAVVVGSGPLDEFIRKKIISSGIENKIEILGALKNEDLFAVLSRMDVFVFASKLPESLGLVAIEALATGTPVIAGNHGAMPEYINSKNGILVDDISCIPNLKSSMEEIMKTYSFEPKTVRGSVQKYCHISVQNTFLEILRDKF